MCSAESFFFLFYVLVEANETGVDNGSEKGNPSKVSEKAIAFRAGRHPALKICDANPILRVTTNRDESEKAPPAVIIVVVGRHWP